MSAKTIKILWVYNLSTEQGGIAHGVDVLANRNVGQASLVFLADESRQILTRAWQALGQDGRANCISNKKGFGYFVVLQQGVTTLHGPEVKRVDNTALVDGFKVYGTDPLSSSGAWIHMMAVLYVFINGTGYLYMLRDDYNSKNGRIMNSEGVEVPFSTIARYNPRVVGGVRQWWEWRQHFMWYPLLEPFELP